MHPSSPKTRIELKQLLSRLTPTGEEQGLLEDAERQLVSVQDEIRALTAHSIAVGRDISVRERKLADWKGKIARENMQPPTRALERAGEMDWVSIGHFYENTLVLHKIYRRSIMGLSGFSHAWLILVASHSNTINIRTVAVAMEKVEERNGLIKFDVKGDFSAQLGLEDYDIVDIKPYLSYCDASNK